MAMGRVNVGGNINPIKSIQRGVVKAEKPGGGTITIPNSVNIDKSVLCLYGVYPINQLSYWFNSSNKIKYETSYLSLSPNIYWEVIEFNDNIKVQKVEVSFSLNRYENKKIEKEVNVDDINKTLLFFNRNSTPQSYSANVGYENIGVSLIEKNNKKYVFVEVENPSSSNSMSATALIFLVEF